MRVQRTLSQSLTLQNLARWVEIVAQVLGGNVAYGSSMANTDEDLNLLIWKTSGVSPGVADTDFTVNHSLKKSPLRLWDKTRQMEQSSIAEVLRGRLRPSLCGAPRPILSITSFSVRV